MNVPRYRVQAIGELRDILKQHGRETYWDVAAFSMESAWRKFITQRFGALKPDPAMYDISLVR